MVQNRNKLIDLFIGNLSNSIVHRILERAIEDEDITSKYDKELMTSLEIARKYREKINPVDTRLPDKDVNFIRTKIISKIRGELLLRIEKGYESINLGLVEELVDNALMDMNVI